MSILRISVRKDASQDRSFIFVSAMWSCRHRRCSGVCGAAGVRLTSPAICARSSHACLLALRVESSIYQSHAASWFCRGWHVETRACSLSFTHTHVRAYAFRSPSRALLFRTLLMTMMARLLLLLLLFSSAVGWMGCVCYAGTSFCYLRWQPFRCCVPMTAVRLSSFPGA